MKNKVEDLLIELGIYPNLYGFAYICKAVEIISRSKERMKIMQLYEEVVKEFDSNTARVERGIRHAFSRIDEDSGAWKCLGIKETTNSVVLYTIVTKLRED